MSDVFILDDSALTRLVEQVEKWHEQTRLAKKRRGIALDRTSKRTRASKRQG